MIMYVLSCVELYINIVYLQLFLPVLFKPFKTEIMNNLYYIVGTIFIIINILFVVYAMKDVIKRKKHKGLIFFFILFPIVGPLVYFQKINKNRRKKNDHDRF